MNRVQLDVRAAVPEAQAPPPTTGEQLSRRVYIRRAVELARCGYVDQCIGCRHAKLGLKPADHSEECCARIVRHMTADADPSQRAQVAQQRIVDTVPSEANEILCRSRHERKSDLRNRLKKKHQRILRPRFHSTPTVVRPQLQHRCRSTGVIRTVHVWDRHGIGRAGHGS